MLRIFCDEPYAAGNGSKSSVELGWGGGSHDSSSYNLGLAGDFSTGSDGKMNTTVTKDEFDIDADSGGGGNDWFRTKYDAKSDVVTATTDGGWTRHNETKSNNHEEVSLESNGNSSFLMGLMKPTGGQVTGSIALDSDGGRTDQWHIKTNSKSKSEDSYNDGSGTTGIEKHDSIAKYELDDVFTSSYDDGSGVTLNADGTAVVGGTSHYEEHYTFDQVTSNQDQGGRENSHSDAYSSTWDSWTSDDKSKTTDHYEADFSADTADGSPPTLAGSDEGHTDYEVSFESCHSWNNSYTYPEMGYSYTDAGGPECTTTAWTTHEDWPSRVDAVLAMMETEADGQTTGEEGGEGGQPRLTFVAFTSKFPVPPTPEIIHAVMVLPDDPIGLPEEWVVDPTHKYPHGIRYRHPNGDFLDWHPGRPGLPGWGGKDHWHWNGKDKHLIPGDLIDDPKPIIVPPPVPIWQRIWEVLPCFIIVPIA